jgi:phenylacetic acid degradation operon negative regulatory protein
MKARSLLFNLWGDYIQHKGGEISTAALTVFSAKFGIQEANLRQALSRMSREGWLISRRDRGRSYYSLTPRGQRRMVEACRRVYSSEELSWDGNWRVLSYSIPESMRALRDELRRELTWTGFGPLAPGTWISPNPLEEALVDLIARYQVEPYVTTFLARHTGPGTPQDLVNRCWELDEIQSSYLRFLTEWRPHMEAAQTITSDDQAFVERIELVHNFRKFLFVDPGLPRELLPENWRGAEAQSLFQEYYALLDSSARRYMDDVFYAGG